MAARGRITRKRRRTIRYVVGVSALVGSVLSGCASDSRKTAVEADRQASEPGRCEAAAHADVGEIGELLGSRSVSVKVARQWRRERQGVANITSVNDPLADEKADASVEVCVFRANGVPTPGPPGAPRPTAVAFLVLDDDQVIFDSAGDEATLLDFADLERAQANPSDPTPPSTMPGADYIELSTGGDERGVWSVYGQPAKDGGCYAVSYRGEEDPVAADCFQRALLGEAGGALAIETASPHLLLVVASSDRATVRASLEGGEVLEVDLQVAPQGLGDYHYSVTVLEKGQKVIGFLSPNEG